MARVCIFCGGRPVTREHVWPDQLSELFPGMTAGAIHSLWAANRPEERREWKGNIFDQRVRVTCHECNHGWLNQLENAAMPWLRPMILGSPLLVPLAPDAQRAVAAYFIRISILAQFLHRGASACIPPDAYDAL